MPRPEWRVSLFITSTATISPYVRASIPSVSVTASLTAQIVASALAIIAIPDHMVEAVDCARNSLPSSPY